MTHDGAIQQEETRVGFEIPATWITFALLLLLSPAGANECRVQSPLHIPAAFKPFSEDLRGHASTCGPISNAHCLSVVSDHLRSAVVSGLLSVGSPDAVFGAVSSVVVQPLDAVLVGCPWPHIGIEVIERIQPSFANSDSTPSISLVGMESFSSASFNHSVPNSVLSAAGHSMFRVSDHARFSLQAPARQTFFLVKARGNNTPRSAALALTLPERSLSWLNTVITQDSPSPDLLSAQVFNILRKEDSIFGSHETFLSTEGNLWIEPASVQPLVRLASLYHKPSILEVV